MLRIKTKGFTLIELLVVIVLLGVVTSFVVLSMGAGSLEREMEEEAKRLHALIKLVREESIIQAKEIAMEIDKQKYSFLEYKGKKWTPLKNKIFKPRKIKQGLRLRVETESESKIIKEKEPGLLRLYFLSSGEQTPFQMKLMVEDSPHPYYLLSAEFSGKLLLEYIEN